MVFNQCFGQTRLPVVVQSLEKGESREQRCGDGLYSTEQHGPRSSMGHGAAWTMRQNGPGPEEVPEGSASARRDRHGDSRWPVGSWGRGSSSPAQHHPAPRPRVQVCVMLVSMIVTWGSAQRKIRETERNFCQRNANYFFC